MTVWDQIAAQRAAGQAPQVLLTKAMLVKKPAGKPGRPKKVLAHFPYGHLMIAQIKGGKGRVRCFNVGCRNRLRNDQQLACSPVCQEYIINFLTRMLQIAVGGKIKVPRALESVVPIVSTQRPPRSVGYQDLIRGLAKGRGRPKKGSSPRSRQERSEPRDGRM